MPGQTSSAAATGWGRSGRVSTAPTSPRRDDETFEAWTDRVEDDLMAAHEAGTFTPFALLDGPSGPSTLFLRPGENDDMFFRRAATTAAETGAVRCALGTTTHVLEAIYLLMWFVRDGDEQAYGMGRFYEGTVFNRVRSDPARAPKSMRRVLSGR